MPLIVPDTLQIGIEMTHSGQTIFNIIGLRVDINSGTRTPQANLAFVKQEWEATGGPMRTHLTGTTMVGYHYTDLRFADGATDFLGSSQAGTNTDPTAALQACAIVKLSGGSRARSEHGRLFHGPLNEADINADGRTLSSNSITTFQNAYNQFKTNMLTHGLGWAVISRKNSTSKDISGISVPSIIGTQRRRLR